LSIATGNGVAPPKLLATSRPMSSATVPTASIACASTGAVSPTALIVCETTTRSPASHSDALSARRWISLSSRSSFADDLQPSAAWANTPTMGISRGMIRTQHAAEPCRNG